MGGDAFRRVKSGEDLEVSARAWNSFLDAAAAVRGHLHDRTQDIATEFLQGDVVKVKNTTGSDAPRFGVLGITGVVFTESDNAREFQNRPTLIGVAPAAATHRGRFAVLLDPIPAGKVGRAYVDGVCVAKLDLVDASHRFAEIIDGDSAKLRSAAVGSARIIYQGATGTGQRLAIVRLGDSPRRLRVGKYEPSGGSDPWTIHTTAEVKIYEAGAAGSETTSDETIAGVVNHSRTVKPGRWVLIEEAPNGRHYLVEVEIPDPTSCRMSIAGEDVEDIPGYDATKIQFLGHSAAPSEGDTPCLQWYSGDPC
jgi:hypothetical protein